jgi:serine/threonine protein kinase
MNERNLSPEEILSRLRDCPTRGPNCPGPTDLMDVALHLDDCEYCRACFASYEKALRDEKPEPVPEAAPCPAGETRFAGRYQQVRWHGTKGRARVGRAYDERLGREVVLKELAPGEGIRKRFLDQARIPAQLQHPGIVPIFDVMEPEGGAAPFYTMADLGTCTLGDEIREYHKPGRGTAEGRMKLRELLRAFASLCKTVAYAHSRGIVHLDLKPENVAWNSGEVVILDWELARRLDELTANVRGVGLTRAPERREGLSQPPTPEDRAATVHQVGPEGNTELMGTPGYMAPEQAEGRLDKISTRTDEYGLGAILYELLTGKPPHRGDDASEVPDRASENKPKSLTANLRGTPRALAAVCLKALAQEPNERYASAQELAKEVERWLSDEPVVVRSQGWWDRARERRERISHWLKRHERGTTWGLVSALVLAVVALTAFLITVFDIIPSFGFLPMSGRSRQVQGPVFQAFDPYTGSGDYQNFNTVTRLWCDVTSGGKIDVRLLKENADDDMRWLLRTSFKNRRNPVETQDGYKTYPSNVTIRAREESVVESKGFRFLKLDVRITPRPEGRDLDLDTVNMNIRVVDARGTHWKYVTPGTKVYQNIPVPRDDANPKRWTTLVVDLRDSSKWALFDPDGNSGYARGKPDFSYIHDVVVEFASPRQDHEESAQGTVDISRARLDTRE